MLDLMCRMAGYVGTGSKLRALVDGSPHGLERQSWAPREMQGAVVNADGWGCAWYLRGELEPCVYRSSLPIWADANRFGLGRTISSSCLMAAVRSATDPLSHALANTQPFVHGPLCFLHNGYVKPFRESIQRRLRRSLGDEAYACVRGETDSEHYFALVVDEWLRAEPGERRAAVALEGATRRLLALTEEAGGVALIAAALVERAVSDPLAVRESEGATPGEGPAGGSVDAGANEGVRTSLVVQRIAVGGSPPSLYVRSAADGWTFASEPLDLETGWAPLEVGAPRVVHVRA